MRGNWSVRELKRQIATQYFERSGLSNDKEALARLAQDQAEAQSPLHIIRDPYVFEFLHLRPQEVMTERRHSLFVSRYQVQLPAQDEMEAFLRRALDELEEIDPAEAGKAGV